MNGPIIATAGFAVIAFIILAFASVVLVKIFKGEIDLDALVAEPPPPGAAANAVGKASLSRFQFLLFTFVVAGLFLLLSIEAGDFVEIPTNVLGLLGISGGSYVVSKAVGQSGTAKASTAADGASPPAPVATLALAGTIAPDGNATLTGRVTPGIGNTIPSGTIAVTGTVAADGALGLSGTLKST